MPTRRSIRGSPSRRLETPWRIAVRWKPRASLHRPFVDGEDHRVALAERHDLAARLHARALLDQHELAAAEIALGIAQQHGRLQREHQLAVEVAVQAVVVARPVAQQQRRRPLLAAGVALPQPALQRGREALVEAELLVPAVGDGGQLGIERLAQPLDRLGQRIGEILVFALAIAVALHDDVAAETRLVGPQGRQRPALVGPDQAGRHGEATVGQGVGVEGSSHGDILPRRRPFFYPPPA